MRDRRTTRTRRAGRQPGARRRQGPRPQHRARRQHGTRRQRRAAQQHRAVRPHGTRRPRRAAQQHRAVRPHGAHRQHQARRHHRARRRHRPARPHQAPQERARRSRRTLWPQRQVEERPEPGPLRPPRPRRRARPGRRRWRRTLRRPPSARFVRPAGPGEQARRVCGERTRLSGRGARRSLQISRAWLQNHRGPRARRSRTFACMSCT
jgi:hypothetical protein